MPDNDDSPIALREAKRLFADWKSVPALVLAVSGGPDSLALMWLAVRWRNSISRGPALYAVTIDHGLRAESAPEAREVGRLADGIGVPHRTLRWRGNKPKTGVPAAAREARYRLLAKAARAHGATHILTAHTRDDQAETLLMRMARGSGIAGLAAMARQSERSGFILARPFLDVSKSRLLATLQRAKLSFAVDPSNADPRFTRPRLRGLMPTLAAEGFDSRNLARLAARFARANAAIDLLVDGAEQYLALRGRGDSRPGFDAAAFAALSAEIRIRLLLRTLARVGHEGQAELGKVEALAALLDRACAETGRAKARFRFKQTLAGAVITLTADRLSIEPAPPRRRRAD